MSEIFYEPIKEFLYKDFIDGYGWLHEVIEILKIKKKIIVFWTILVSHRFSDWYKIIPEAELQLCANFLHNCHKFKWILNEI